MREARRRGKLKKNKKEAEDIDATLPVRYIATVLF